MFSSAEKSKNVNVSRQQSGGASFFRKAGEESFFGATESPAFFSSPVQPKLSVSQPDDPYEKEADHVADTVMRMSEPSFQPAEVKDNDSIQAKEEEQEEIQPKLIGPQISSIQCKEEDQEIVQTRLMSSLQRRETEAEPQSEVDVIDSYHSLDRKPLSPRSQSLVQRSGRGPPAESASFEQTLMSSKGGGSALPETTKSFMESRFNSRFEGVRIHTGSTAETLSRNIHAQAFTHGNDIYFNSGKYSPHTADGGHLLAHELTHTVQQGASKPVSSNVSLARKPIIQRSAEAAVPQLSNAIAKAKGEEGKVNANNEGPDGYRTGWERLIEYFKTTFGADKIIRNGQASVDGAVGEEQIKKKSTVKGPRPAKPEKPADGQPYMRDAMPSWCGIFVFWALNKGGVPMPKWELGGRMMKPEAAYPPGYIPKAGDIAYRDDFSHYAIVEKADATTVTTVNGNTSGEDNLGAQVQTRDHPMSGWTAFFDPLKLKTGSLGSGEGAEPEKPKTLKELRKELFNVNRKEEPGNDQEEEIGSSNEQQVQAKSELSDWSVNAKGELNHAPPLQAKVQEEKLQAKEEEKYEEDHLAGQTEHSLQRKRTSLENTWSATKPEPVAAGGTAMTPLNTVIAGKAVNYNSHLQKREETGESNRGPPIQLKANPGTIQCSWFDDAFSTVSNFVADTLEAGKRLLLTEARDFVMAIPGYRALRVVLGEDPITGEDVERNGHNFIEAAFDIMPGGRLLHQKLTELGALDGAATWIDQQIVSVESIVDGVLGRISQFVNSITLEWLSSPRQLFEEAGNIIHSTINSIIDFAVNAARELLEFVKRFLIEQIVTFIREQTPAYPLLRVILGKDPVTDEDVVRNGNTILDALLELGGEEGKEQRKQMQETGTFQKVAGWIDEGIEVFSGAYREIKAGFLEIWNDVSIEMLMHPIDTFNRIYNTFVAPVSRVLNFVIRAGAVILKFIKEVLMRRLSAWARTVRGYHLVTVIIGKDPFTDEIVPFSMDNVIRGFMSLMEGGDSQFDQLKESGAIDRTTERITAAVERLNMTPAAIAQLFADLWDSFSLNDLADPLAAFQRILDRFGEPIGRLIAFVVEIVRIVIEVILQVMNFPGDLIANIISKAMQAFEMIKTDPVGFLKNLLRAIKQGFIQFFDNIAKHLMGGLVGWLTSELKDAGVPELTDTSLRGVIGWVLQILDITMEKIWQKLAAHPRIGPARVAQIRGMINTLEGVWSFIKDVQERGIAAIWDKIQEQLTNLWDTILNSIKTWIMDQIINKMVTKLLSMLDPTGVMAVINSTIALYSAIQSFIKYLREMLEIVNSFVEGVVDIASGNITTAANYLERTMARAIPIVIGFLANQVGLSGIGKRIGTLIGQAREMVDQALTWVVERAVTMGSRLLEMGRAAAGAVLEWAKGLLGLEQPFTTPDNVTHRIYFVQEGDTIVLKLNPVPAGNYEDKMNEINLPDAPNDKVAIPGAIAVPLRSNSRPGAPSEGTVSVSPDSDGKVSMTILKSAALRVARHIDGLIRSNKRTETDSATGVQDITPLFSASLGGLGSITKHLLSSEVGGGLLPVSGVPEYGTLMGGFASRMNIKPLTRLGVPGTSVGITSPIYEDLLLRRETPGGRSYYIAGHLLNNNLHGSGSSWQNLTPIAQRTNGKHERDVESKVKAAADKGLIVQYTVDVSYNIPEKTNLVGEIEGQPNWQTNSLLAQKHKILKAEASLPASLVCTVKQLKADGTDLPNDEAEYNFNAVQIDNTEKVIQNSLDEYYLTDATAASYKLISTLLTDATDAIEANSGILWNDFYNKPGNKVSIDHLSLQENDDLKNIFKRQALINEERIRIDRITEMITFSTFCGNRIAYASDLLTLVDKNNLQEHFQEKVTSAKENFIQKETGFVQNSLADPTISWGGFRNDRGFVARENVLSEEEIQSFRTTVFDFKIKQLTAAVTTADTST